MTLINKPISNGMQRGYTHFENYYSLFCKREKDSVVLLALYVDDVLLTNNNESVITDLKGFLDSIFFKFTDLCYAHYFLGIEIL